MRKLYILGLIGLACIITGLVWAEEVTITTYYPAPYGVYRLLTLAPTTVPGSPQEGMMYYDDLDDQIYFYDGFDWQPLGGGFWTQSDSNLYPNDTNWNVGIGTTDIPHGGIGYAKFAIEGSNASSAGPHVQYTTATNNYPVFQQLNWSHDNISLNFDSYYDGTWRSTDAGSNFQIYKIGDLLRFRYDSGIAAGSALTWNEGIVLDTAGNVGIGTTGPQNKLQVHTTTANDHLLITGTAPGIQFSELETGTERAAIGLATAAGHYTSTAAANDLVIRTVTSTGDLLFATDTTYTERMRITDDGTVRIPGSIRFGTGVPGDINMYKSGAYTVYIDQDLQVSGNNRGASITSNRWYYFGTTPDASFEWDNSAARFYWRDSGTIRMYLDSGTGNLYIDGTYQSFSPEIPEDEKLLIEIIKREVNKPQTPKDENGNKILDPKYAKDIGSISLASGKLILKLVEKINDLENKVDELESKIR